MKVAESVDESNVPNQPIANVDIPGSQPSKPAVKPSSTPSPDTLQSTETNLAQPHHPALPNSSHPTSKAPEKAPFDDFFGILPDYDRPSIITKSSEPFAPPQGLDYDDVLAYEPQQSEPLRNGNRRLLRLRYALALQHRNSNYLMNPLKHPLAGLPLTQLHEQHLQPRPSILPHRRPKSHRTAYRSPMSLQVHRQMTLPLTTQKSQTSSRKSSVSMSSIVSCKPRSRRLPLRSLN